MTHLPKNPFKKTLKKDVKTSFKLSRRLLGYRLVKILLLLAILFFTLPLVFFAIYRPKIQDDINYGVTFSYRYAEEIGLDWRDAYIKMFDDLGVKNVRLVAYWDDIEQERDVYNFEIIKWQLDEAEKRNVNVILTLGRKVPRWPECFEPKWWHELEDKVTKDNELFEYEKETIKALQGYESIKMWQVENEPFFKFGHCPLFSREMVAKEVNVVKAQDSTRPILVQDSGEGGFWFPAYTLGDHLGISMYRKIWYDFWGVFFGKAFYFKYPLAHWTYKIKAEVLRVPYEKIIVTELQAEPWGPVVNSELTEEQKNKTMSRNDFLDTLSYAQKAGFKDLYLWGVEWWLWEKEMNNNGFYWDTAKALFN